MIRTLSLLALLAVLPALSATVALKMDIESLAEKSTLIVVAKINSKESRWDASKKGIWTHHEITVEDTLKGSADADQKLVTRGGVVGKLGQNVAGSGQFKIGERAVFFLWKDATKRWRLTGMAQGAFKITGAKVKNSVAGIKLVNSDLKALKKADKQPLEFELADFKSDIKELVKAAKKDDNE
ncbi:MAG: hypothetical protein L3J82_03250 [Planctomycetes bacterium]|nr:hypothetical protein [Planctomycetota bacterium]